MPSIVNLWPMLRSFPGAIWFPAIVSVACSRASSWFPSTTWTSDKDSTVAKCTDFPQTDREVAHAAFLHEELIPFDAVPTPSGAPRSGAGASVVPSRAPLRPNLATSVPARLYHLGPHIPLDLSSPGFILGQLVIPGFRHQRDDAKSCRHRHGRRGEDAPRRVPRVARDRDRDPHCEDGDRTRDASSHALPSFDMKLFSHSFLSFRVRRGANCSPRADASCLRSPGSSVPGRRRLFWCRTTIVHHRGAGMPATPFGRSCHLVPARFEGPDWLFLGGSRKTSRPRDYRPEHVTTNHHRVSKADRALTPWFFRRPRAAQALFRVVLPTRTAWLPCGES